MTRVETLQYPSIILRFVEICGGQDALRNRLWYLAIVYLSIMAVRSFAQYTKGRFVAVGSENTSRKMKNALYDHLQRLPYDYHVNAETGDLIQRCTTDVETVRKFLAIQMTEFIRVSSMIIIALTIMIPLNWILTIASLALMPFIVLFSSIFFKRVQKQFTLVEESDGKLSTVLQEGLTGVRVVRAFGRQEFEREKFMDISEDWRDKTLKLISYFGYFYGGSDALVSAQTIISIVLGIIFTINGSITPGQYIVFISYVMMMIWPIRQFGRILSDMGKALIAAGRLDEVLSQKREDNGVNPLVVPLDKDIEYKNVKFGYDDNEVLKDVSFSVKSGETIAILGATGTGKSTIVQLLQRLYDIEDGAITIGGVDIREIDKNHLRKRIGIVLQEPFLYSRTLKENIGITQDTKDDEAVFKAARTASVHDVIERFEHGYETMVGERGVTLSGGQKQRVAIARTVLRDSDILIFDDSLSAVDTETDRKIRRELKERQKGVTTFIISHRITTLKEADKILVWMTAG